MAKARSKTSSPEVSELSEDIVGKIGKHTKMGDTFFQRRDFTNAMIEYQDIVKLDSENTKAHYMLGKILMAMSDYEEALKEFDKVVSIRPMSGDAHFNKAEALRMLGRYEDAQKEIQHFLEDKYRKCFGARIPWRVLQKWRGIPLCD